MGIPHLITFLRPYAENKSLAGDAIIDGPGLAYHIFYLCLNSNTSARDPFEAAPAYEELGNTALEWLKGLRESGIIVKKIYFDGYLPPSKLNVRLDRLRTQTKLLNGYHATSPIPGRPPPASPRPASQVLFNNVATYLGLTALPPAPFLVPAILDTLRASDTYRTVVEIVPGEADSYCARYLKQSGGIVITGDSDLLVHDLSSVGAVCFFKDIESTQNGTLSSLIYTPTAIAERLALPKSHGLKALAFEILRDRHGTFAKLLAQAISLKTVKANEAEYKDFCKGYATPPLELEVGNPSYNAERSKFVDALQHLDPRLSEYILQISAVDELAARVVSGSNVPRVFLPFLIDCPIRTSAWEMSTSVRQLAYGLVNLILPEPQQISSVFEHRKQNNNAGAREWKLPKVSEVLEACKTLVSHWDGLIRRLPKLAERDSWIALAVYQEVDWSSSHVKPVLSNLVLQRVNKTEGKPKVYTWDIVHCLAQLHGSYYSLRMLKQIMGFVISHNLSDHFLESLSTLHKRLEQVPMIDECSELSDVLSVMKKIELSGILDVSYGILSIQEKKSSKPSPESTKKTRKRRKQNPTARQLSNQKPPSNPFELLEAE